MSIEKRLLSIASELRASGSGDNLTLTGYAAKFNVLSHDLGDYREKIAPGAFKQSIANGDDCVCTFNHDDNSVLGRTKSGTLLLAEDNIGLRFTCWLDKNQSSHRDIHAAVKRNDIQDCSFAFQCPEDGCDFDQCGVMEDGVTPCNIRTLRKLTLVDVSVVVHPAYPATQVDARSIAAFNAKRTERKARIRRALDIAAEYSPLPIEEISRCIRLGYSADVMNQLRAAAYGEHIRSAAFGDMDVASPRSEDGGQVSDAQQSLRDDDDIADSFDWDADWDPLLHDNAAKWHKFRSWGASTLQGSTSHLVASALHQKAASALRDKPKHPDSQAASKKARVASKELL